jgi:hypothetical protein
MELYNNFVVASAAAADFNDLTVVQKKHFLSEKKSNRLIRSKNVIKAIAVGRVIDPYRSDGKVKRIKTALCQLKI